MNKDNSLEHIDNKKMLKLVGTIAGPIALQGLIGSSLNLVDNLMIGGLGELALNAVGVSVQIFFIYWLFIYGFASGAATYISQFYGVKDFTSIKKTVGFSYMICLCMGLLFFIGAIACPQYILRVFTSFPEVIEAGTDYVRIGAPCFLLVAILQPLVVALRVTQQTVYPLISSSIALGINTIMNYCLIYGKLGFPQMEIRGAALATVISRCVEVGIILVMVFGRKNVLKGRISDYLGISKGLASRVFKNSIPTTMNETLWALGTSMYIAAFARIGITEGAAVQACNTINNLFTMAAFSVGDAILILVGQKLGEGKKVEAYEMTKYLLRMAAIVGVIFGVILFAVRIPVVGLFNFTEYGYDVAGKILIVYAAVMWLKSLNCAMVTGVLRCGGDTRYAMFAEVGAVWIIGVPAAFLSSLVFKWPIYGAVLAVQLVDIIEFILLYVRFRSKKWLNTVIKDI